MEKFKQAHQWMGTMQDAPPWISDSFDVEMQFEPDKRGHYYLHVKTPIGTELVYYEDWIIHNDDGLWVIKDDNSRIDLMLAIRYLKEAKARFGPNTTNSFVDDLIAKYGEVGE